MEPILSETSDTIEKEFTENPSNQSHSQDVKRELIMLSLPAIAGQAIEPFSQLMETAYIGRLGMWIVYVYSMQLFGVVCWFILFYFSLIPLFNGCWMLTFFFSCPFYMSIVPFGGRFLLQ